MIYIIWAGPFPYGMASTNRIYLYAKGLVEFNERVTVLMTRPTEKDSKKYNNKISKGSIDNIDFEYTCGRTEQSNHLLGKLWWVLLGSIRAAIIVLFSNEKKKDTYNSKRIFI